jgi:hypothetical protein
MSSGNKGPTSGAGEYLCREGMTERGTDVVLREREGPVSIDTMVKKEGERARNGEAVI